MTIGIDLGGTHLRMGVVDRQGKILARRKIVVGGLRTPKSIVQLISSNFSEIKSHRPRVRWRIGLGVAGIVGEGGIVYSSPHYPQWRNFKVAQKLSQRINIPVVVDNDANMVALGELWQGAGQGWDSFLMITLGTGIGGAIVIDKKVFHGDNGFAGEIGHMVVEAKGPRCACGSRGCWEVFASGSGMEKRGDRNFGRFAYYLGVGLASLVNVTGIQRIIIGGGLVSKSRFYLPAAIREMKRRTYAKTWAGVKIRLAKLGDDAGVLGAARMIL